MKQIIQKRSRPCPLCCSGKSEKLYVQTFAGGLTHDIACCSTCGFVFVSNSPDQAYYNEYYRSMSKYEIERAWDYHERYATIIAEQCPKSGSVLDIGCSTGHLMSVLREKGFKNLKGLDPSPVCRQLARERYDVEVITANLFDYRPRKKFDVVVLAAVLEHIDLVRDAVAQIGTLLADGGSLFIAVPDAGRFFERFDEPFGEFSTEHINFFTQSDLYRTLPNYRMIHMHSDTLAIYSLWRKESEGRTAISRYIEASQRKMDRVEDIIDKLPERVIVWGAGALTRRLLLSTSLKKKVVKFVDKSANLIGTRLEGIEILAPEQLSAYREPVLVSSFSFKEEIVATIKRSGLRNRIHTLC